jgi:RNA polymerase sigma factor (sigma-70 family)
MKLGKVLDHVRQALRRPSGGVTDSDLLARFVATRDEEAFAALVERHGPLVLGVCRRVLGNYHDAEDAFQAAFLVLATRARAVAKRDSVGSWLYVVAYRTALEARSANARRRARERQVEHLPHPEVAPAEPQDWRPLLDQELSRLPDKYRAPVVLCDLEGKTYQEAACLLGVAVGTLSSRLAAARKRLAGRLARTGLALSGGALAAALPQGATGQVPAALVSSTARAAALVAAGHLAAVATPAAVLSRGVLKAMFMTKLKVALALVLVVALGAGGLSYRATGQPAPTVEKRPPADVAGPRAGKPLSELEALRRENELLRLNLRIVLEKCRALEAQGKRPGGDEKGKAAFSKDGFRPNEKNYDVVRPTDKGKVTDDTKARVYRPSYKKVPYDGKAREYRPTDKGKRYSDAKDKEPAKGEYTTPQQVRAAQEVQRALDALRHAPDREARRRAAEALERATRRLQEQLRRDGVTPGPVEMKKS